MNDNAALPHPPLPLELRPALAGARWLPVTVGMSGALVWRIETAGQPPRYLKQAAGPRARELREERDRLLWLRDRLPVPSIDGWTDEGERAWLLLGAMPGVMAHEPALLGDIPALVRALGEGLRRVHDVPISGCPFDARLDVHLARVAWQIEVGLVDEPAIRADHDLSAHDFLQRLIVTRPAEPSGDLVFTHGDYCLPNILLTPDGAGVPRVTGLLDWGRSGVSDRYQDLAIGARSLRYNLGPGWEPLFFAAYGISAPDSERLAWYEALDELF
jgi:aminoglycoside phosphotransferase